MTDKIRMSCPNCQKKLAVKASLAGKRVRCPDTTCATLIKVPAPAENVEEAPSASSKARLLWLGLGGGGLALLLAVGVGMWAMSGGAKSRSVQPDDATANVGQEQVRGGALSKQNVLGEWEGSLKDGSTVALKFTEKLVVVSILAPGIDRGKAREAAEYASGDIGRALRGGGFGIGSTAYEIDAEKNEVKIWGAEGWAGVAKPTKDGALLVSGDVKIGTVPETRIERVKFAGAQRPVFEPASKLPGAAGPAQVELGKPPAGIAVKEINLLGEFSLRPKDQKLPSGTEQFSVEIAFPFLPNGTQISVEVHSEQGLVPAPPRSLVRTRRSATEVRMSLECQTRDGTPFADGPYQAKVLINGQAVAALNFSVEGTPVADVDAAPLLKGTKWESKYGDGSGYRLEFGDKGTFEVHGLVSSGGHKPQWDKKAGSWSAKGDTFAAHADPAGEPRLRSEFRGKYVKKLNELLIKVRHQSKGDDGAIRFGGWYEVAAGKKVPAFSTGQPLGKSSITEEKAGQLTQEQLLGKWKGKLKNGTVELEFLKEKQQRAVLVLKLTSGEFAVGSVFYKIDGKNNEVDFGKASAKPTRDGAFLLSGEFMIGGNTYRIPDTRIERVGSSAPKQG